VIEIIPHSLIGKNSKNEKPLEKFFPILPYIRKIKIVLRLLFRHGTD